MVQKMSEDEEIESFDDDDEVDEDLGDMFSGDGEGSKRKEISDDDDDIEDDGEQNPKLGSAKKKRKLRKENEMKKLNQPPTVEELNRLRETENLFHSNLFRRQIEEMLKELELKKKHQVRINLWFEKLKDWVLKAEDGDQTFDLSDASWLKNRKTKLPLTQFEKKSKGHYCFKKPSAIKLIGSYSTKTMLGPSEIDVAIEMPQSFFEKEDYLNGRYYKKRAIYLCDIAEHILAMTDLATEAKFKTDDGDNWRPILEITPCGKLSKHFKFLLHVVPNKNSFRLNRFIPERNNVRSGWFLGSGSEVDDKGCPTPEYNNGILRDLCCLDNEQFVSEVFGQNSQLRDAIVLLKVWAKQRELHLGFGGFSGHFWSMLIAYLLQIRKLGAVTSSYKVVRTVWNYLVSADWSKNGISLCNTTTNQQPQISDFHSNFPLVFIDPSGFLNLCGGMDLPIFQRCQDEAGLALRSLDTPDINCFHVLFMTPAPFSRLCDQVIVFSNWNSLKKLVAEYSSNNKKLSFCGMIYPQAKDLLVSLLQRGFNERIRRLFVKPVKAKSWAVNKKPLEASVLTLGIVLDPENCYSVVDKGPVADPTQSEGFRDFWGKRSELRRFKDGSITESVVWEAKSWKEKRMICRQVAQFLLESKFQFHPADFHYVGDELEEVLPRNREQQTCDVVLALEDLIKTLRGLNDLPLNVISVQGSSEVFRSSDVFPPALGKLSKKCGVLGNCAIVNSDIHRAPSWCPVAEVVLQLGSSNKWPRDLDAVRRVRAAFNLKISELLTREKLVTHAYQDWVDVLTQKCVFRLRIIYPGEVALMKKGFSPDGVVLYRDTEESLLLEKKGIHLPKLTSALSGVQSQFSAYGPACAIAKRWVRSHLFHTVHISDEALDLLVASIFVNPEPWQPPTQPQTAFLRFLSLLSRTNWNIEFILLNFNQVLTSNEKHDIESHFDNQRSSLPCMFIATPDDRTRSIWTRNGPQPVILLRLCNLAQKTLEVLEQQLFTAHKPEIMPVFEPSLDVFDVVIRLIAGFVPKHYQSLSTMNAIEDFTTPDGLSTIPVVNFDPVDCYLKELRESYDEWALFFYDVYGGKDIGVLWKPGAHQPRDIKVAHLNGRQIDTKTNTLILNVDAILEGFHIIGKGIVKSIEVKRDDRLVPFQF